MRDNTKQQIVAGDLVTPREICKNSGRKAIVIKEMPHSSYVSMVYCDELLLDKPVTALKQNLEVISSVSR